MAQNGIFRTAMRGFNKQDVLQYIDEITAAWNGERTQLEQQTATATAAAEELRAAAELAQTQAAGAIEQAQVAETQLAEVKQLYHATADLAERDRTLEELSAQLQELRGQIEALERSVTAVTAERDEAIAAVADAREQLAGQASTEQQLEESRRQVQRQDDQIVALQKAVARYEKVLGSAETAHQRVDGIVRPFIEQANKQADETLDSVQAVLAGVLAQLGELQGSVEQRRQALHRCRRDSDSRLSAAFGDWLGQAQDGAPPTDRYFFR